jgi:hypothetical protein
MRSRGAELAATEREGMEPSCDWEAHGPWQTSDGEPSQIKRIVYGSSTPAAACGKEILHKGEHAVTITYRVFQWGHIVGVLDADAAFDLQQQKGGRAWGIAAMGCGFVETVEKWSTECVATWRNTSTSTNCSRRAKAWCPACTSRIAPW